MPLRRRTRRRRSAAHEAACHPRRHEVARRLQAPRGLAPRPLAQEPLPVSIHVALNHVTHYRYDRRVTLSPQVVRLRPAPVTT